MKNPNLKFIFGIILIVCGWIICFDVFLLMIGLAFFLLGTILVLTAKKKLWVKILTIGVPILLWFIGFELILHQINKKTAITVLFPENFSGQARIVYGEKNGLIPSMENGRMILSIPRNGNLIIQPHLETGLTDMEFYFVDETGKRTKINQVNEEDHYLKYSTVLYQGVTSSAVPFGQSSDVPPALDYLYESFYVFAPYAPDKRSIITQSNPASFAEESKNNPLTDSLVKIERGIK